MDRKSKGRPKKRNDELAATIEAIKKKYDEFDSKRAATFADFPLSEKTLYGLERAGFLEPTDIQRESIVSALRGRDLLGAAMTGSGKTLAFLIPVLESLWRDRWSRLDGLGALIISPTRELAMQIYDVLRMVGGEHDFSAALVVGGTDVNYEAKRLAGKNVVVGTPGRLLQHMDENPNFTCDAMKLLVIDEADRLLDMGFERQLNAIVSNLPAERQTLLFSATQTRSVRDLARLSLKDPVYVSVHEHAKYSTPDQLKQTYVVCEEHEKLNMLWSFVKNHQQEKVLVFVANCKQVRLAFEAFRRLRPHTSLVCLHGGMVQSKRVSVYKQFCNKRHVVLLATDIAARGLDFPGVEWVVQLDCPPDANEYIHRCGRTARYHRDGKALLVLTPSQEQPMIDQLTETKIPITKITMNPSMLVNVQKKLVIFCTQDAKFKTLAQQAFVAYIRSIFLMSNKKVFDVNGINFEAMAKSYGLAVTPRVRFLRKQKATNSNSTGDSGTVYSKPPNMVNEGAEEEKEVLLEIGPEPVGGQFSGWQEDQKDLNQEEEEEDDLLLVKHKDVFNVAHMMKDEPEPLPGTISKSKLKKGPLTREVVAKKILKKKIVANKKVTFDEEGNMSLGLNDSRGGEGDGGQDREYRIELAKKLMEEEDKVDRRVYRKRIKEKHRDERRKRKLADAERRGAKDEEGPRLATLGPAEGEEPGSSDKEDSDEPAIKKKKRMAAAADWDSEEEDSAQPPPITNLEEVALRMIDY